MRIDPAQFRALPLAVHHLLADVPLRDVTAVDLPGGGAGRTIAEIEALADGEEGRGANPVVQFLFWVRITLGKLFGWDKAPFDPASSYLTRVSPALRARSRGAPGEAVGFFRLLYRLEDELVLEARNATVHAFLASVLRPVAGSGYRLYWAVYVKPVSWFTPIYMAAIEPFRRFIVYPTLMRRLRRRWRTVYPSAVEPASVASR